jgi:hypothetical protein
MTSRTDPAPVAILAARIMRAYPSLLPFSAASLATELCAIERAQRKHAERCCSGADGGYVKHRLGAQGWVTVHNPDAEERAGERIAQRVTAWGDRCLELWSKGNPRTAWNRPTIELQGDPRGHVLLVRLPGETEASWV